MRAESLATFQKLAHTQATEQAQDKNEKAKVLTEMDTKEKVKANSAGCISEKGKARSGVCLVCNMLDLWRESFYDKLSDERDGQRFEPVWR